uniref:Uncharacterized protein n=1 Tax=Pipistrellus kuhlii TaxID=59472 RepID=A0A7J7XB95_PIPKU|nr:hypothetical protein mPipKuh1_010668 [Pipistrellus kuhlii]
MTELLLDPTQLPLTAKPEQAQGRVLGTRILVTDVPLRLPLRTGVKGEDQASWEGGLLGSPWFEDQHLSRSQGQPAILPSDKPELAGPRRHKMTPKSPFFRSQCCVCKMRISRPGSVPQWLSVDLEPGGQGSASSQSTCPGLQA